MSTPWASWLDTIDPDIREHTDDSVAAINLQNARNRGEVVLGVDLHPRMALVKDLLSSDGGARSGDENLTGLGAALATLDDDLRMTVSAALWGAAKERLAAAEHADSALYLSPDEFRERALESAEQLARLWREACHAKRHHRREGQAEVTSCR